MTVGACLGDCAATRPLLFPSSVRKTFPLYGNGCILASMNLPEFLRDIEAKVYDVIRDAFHRFHQDFHSPSEQRIMASVALLTQTVTDLSNNVNTLTTAVQTLVANQGSNQAQFEAQLDPVEQAIEQLNGAITQLTGAITAPTA